jgi:hypothetical protein
MIKLFYAFAWIFATTVTCFSQQNALMLQKKNSNKNVFYRVGDVISFNRKGDRSKITAKILDLKDSVIVFKGYEVHVKNITCLYIDHKTRWWLRFKAAQLLLLAGSGFLVLDVINTGELSKETLMISGVAIGAGLIAKVLIGNRIKINRRTKLRILKY